jgi:cell division transport system permease protein
LSQALLFDSLVTEVRIFNRILLETFGGLRRSGWMNVVIVITMGSILAIFGSLTLLVLDSQFYVGSLGNSIELSVYLKDDAKTATTQKSIEAIEGVKQVSLVTKEEAWSQMKHVDEVPDIPNPLPDTLRVRVEKPQWVEPLQKQLQAMDAVEEVQYPYRVLKTIQDITRFVGVFGLAFTLFLGVLTSFIISNTIHLLIEARSREIEILRMMGVGNWYIRLPFLFQGAFYGLLGAGLAYLPLPSLQLFINQAITFLQFKENPYSLPFVLVLMLIIGMSVGTIGSYLSVRRFLRV